MKLALHWDYRPHNSWTPLAKSVRFGHLRSLCRPRVAFIPLLYRGPGKNMLVLLSKSQTGPGRKFSQPRANFFRGLCTCVSTSILIKLAGGHCGQGAESGGLQSNYGPSFRLTLSRRVCWASRFVRSFPSSTIAERPKIPSPMSFARRSLSLADAAVALSLSVLLSAHPVCHSLEGSRFQIR